MKITELKKGAQYQRLLGKLLQKFKRVNARIISLKRNIFASKNEVKLKSMIENGEVVIIPAGFRCYTKERIFKNLNFTQPSMPFDNGFFPPSSIASVIKNPIINLKYDDNNLTHSVCVKYEEYVDSVLGRGIKFQKASYAEIDSLAISSDMNEINKYVDSTFGYYTLDVEHNYVLAHYNWHKFSDQGKSKGIHDPNINLENINKILNKRIQRMFDLCNSASYVFFVVGEFQEYQYMMIDNNCFELHCFNELVDAVESTFNARCFVVTVADVDSADNLLAMIG